MALFELTELASYLQKDLDTATATLARELATGLVLDVTGILEESTVTVVLPIDPYTGVIDLPSRVVTEVAEVIVDGTAMVSDVDYVWERPFPTVVLLHVSTLSEWPTATVTVTVGYSAGNIPRVAKAVALSAAARVYDNPGGLRSESVDDYSLVRAGSDTDLAGFTLTDAERQALARLTASAHVTASR